MKGYLNSTLHFLIYLPSILWYLSIIDSFINFIVILLLYFVTHPFFLFCMVFFPRLGCIIILPSIDTFPIAMTINIILKNIFRLPLYLISFSSLSSVYSSYFSCTPFPSFSCILFFLLLFISHFLSFSFLSCSLPLLLLFLYIQLLDNRLINYNET